MKLQKAAELLDIEANQRHYRKDVDTVIAFKIAHAAISRLLDIRSRDPIEALTLLPGETP